MTKFNEMLALVAEKHDGQFDLHGVAYVFHVMAVAEYVRERWGHKDEELLCIALGHDLIEDTNVTWQYLADSFGFRVANGILALSNIDGYSYEEYQNKVLSSKDALRVKICDLRHNMQSNRVRNDGKSAVRMDKYSKFRDLIEEKLHENSIY